MSLDDKIPSPHRRPQTVFTVSPSYKQLYSRGDELGSCSALLKRHRFLLTAMGLLAFLCTIYLYFAITLGGVNDSCFGLTVTEKATCLLERGRALAKGKLKF